MAFASPLLWWAVAVAATGTVLLHLLSWRRPKPRLLPTARFIPPATQPSRFRRVEPSDLAVLLLRLVALVALGAAAAGPLVRWRRDGVARVLLVDRSRAVADMRASAAAAESLATGAAGVRVVAFDSIPVRTQLSLLATDTSRALVAGRLGAALVAATHEAAELRAQYDSVEVVLISPFVEEEVDPALPLIVAASGGGVRLHRVGAASADVPRHPANASLPGAGDPVGAAAWVAWGSEPAHLRLSRTLVTPSDSAFARAGGTVVSWPAGTARPDAAAGIVVGAHSVVGPFAAPVGELTGMPVARWHDGRVAATEEPLGAGCVRHVAVQVPARGDIVLRPAFTGVVRALTSPCATARLALADAALLRGPPGTQAAAGVTTPDVRLQRLLAALALIALGLEMWVRRARRTSTASLASAPRRAREAA